MSSIFYRDRRLLVMTIMLLVVVGLAGLSTLPRMEDPRLTMRFGSVVTRWEGKSALKVDSLVTKKIEEELEEIQEIKQLLSTSRTGVSVIQIELKDEVGPGEVDEVWSRVRDKLDDAQHVLPVGSGEPDFENKDTEAYTLIAALTWSSAGNSGSGYEVNHNILRRLAEQLEDELRGVSGTEHTDLFGEGREEIRVEIDQSKLAELGLSVGELADRIRGADAKVAAGAVKSKESELVVEVGGEIEALNRVRGIVLRGGEGGEFVTVGDIAKVSKTVEEPLREIGIFHGRVGVGVAARMDRHRRVDQWAAEARGVIEKFGAGMGEGVKVDVVFDQSGYTEERLSSLTVNFLLGTCAVTLVILVMMGWQSALIVGAALPLSALMVLGGMRYLGVPIHQMSVSGLIIALGLLIDNAIVIVDETRRRFGRGEGAVEAIGGSVRYLFVPLLGSTLTTVLAFMPIILMPGPAGEFVGGIAISVILALLSSFFLAMTVIPALSGLMQCRGKAMGERGWLSKGLSSEMWAGGYRRFLDAVLGRAWIGIVVGLALPVFGFFAASTLVEQFFPPSDRDQFQMHLRLGRHVSIEETRKYADRARELMLKHGGVEEVHWFVGNSAPMFYYNMNSGENDSQFFAHGMVKLKSNEGASGVIRELQALVGKAMPEAEVLALELQQGPPFVAPIELEIFGPDVDVLDELGEKARRILAGVDDVVVTRADLVTGGPKLKVGLDDDRARLVGLSNVEVARQLEGALEGVLGGSMIEGGEELGVRVRLIGEVRGDVSKVASMDLVVGGERRDVVPLDSIGKVGLEPEVSSIGRRDGRRRNNVMGYIQAGVLPGDVLAKFEARLKEEGLVMPAGYEMKWGGETDKRDEAVGKLMASVAVLGVMMVVVLVMSLRSFRLAGLIGVVALASVGLGQGMLWVFGFPAGFMAIVGTMGLIGVAINDSIVVLTALRSNEQAMKGDVAATREVVVGATRHVLSTTVTTAAGFLPLILSGGTFWPPLAVVIAGGVVGATLLALTVVPSGFLLVYAGRCGMFGMDCSGGVEKSMGDGVIEAALEGKGEVEFEEAVEVVGEEKKSEVKEEGGDGNAEEVKKKEGVTVESWW